MPFGYAAFYYNNQPDQSSTRPPTLPLFLERADEHKDEVECVVGPTHRRSGTHAKHLVGPKCERVQNPRSGTHGVLGFVLVGPSTVRMNIKARLPHMPCYLVLKFSVVVHYHIICTTHIGE